MEKKYSPEITRENDQLSLKRLAMGGPCINALISLPDLKITFVNKQFEHYLGYSNQDIESQDLIFSNILEEYQLDRFLYQAENAKNSIDAHSRFVIYQLKNKNGEAGSYYLFISPAYMEEGTDDEGLYHITLHPNNSKWDMPFTSFTTKELFLEHFDSENFGTFEWLMDMDKVFWSEGMYRIYEMDNVHEQINRIYDKTIIHPNDRARVEEATARSIATGEDLNIDYKIITAKQNIKIIHCLARPVQDGTGKAAKFAGSLRDVTDLRSKEEDLKNKVKELYHSNKELEEFAYVASHDMQEPLRKITTFSDRLSEKYKDVLKGDGGMYLSRMIASAANMRMLIDNLLEFSKISKTVLPFERVNLNNILWQVKTDLELTIEETGTVINSPALPTIDGISSQMKQLFSNIIGNAIKFHKPDVTPVITIASSELSDSEKLHYELAPNGGYYKLQFTDNGIGFESEYAARIFQVFQRLHGKSEYPGSGIGLAICKKIAEYHHGIIFAENIEGQGARFVFIIPQHIQKPKELNL